MTVGWRWDASKKSQVRGTYIAVRDEAVALPKVTLSAALPRATITWRRGAMRFFVVAAREAELFISYYWSGIYKYDYIAG